ncbi:HK97 family phage prohead protease [Neorhizobium sp. LjRoot104]|uniref:HK97 family phage prohead protease n=1 Tax=Neorhizobium sp. LjRoot104 TaxID=3342254 RepID=UPI003ED12ED1
MTHELVKSISLDTREARTGDTFDFETRFTSASDTGEIEGVAVRFNTVDTYRTEFAPDAFHGLEGRSVPMLWAHDPSNVIGSWSSFQVRADGLTAKGKLNLAVAKALEVRSLLQAGDIKGLSIGFRTVKDERRSNGIRRIMQALLHEISIVAFPSVPGSGITSVRASTPDLSTFTRAVSRTIETLRKD